MLFRLMQANVPIEKISTQKLRTENKKEGDMHTYRGDERFFWKVCAYVSRPTFTYPALLEKINTCLLTAKRQGQCSRRWCTMTGRHSAGQKSKSVKTVYTTILELNYMFVTTKLSCSFPGVKEFRGDLKTRKIKYK